MSGLVAAADAYAAQAHGAIDHRRKYTGEPYIAHPREVMAIVAGVPHTDAMLAAALLHDTVEDTPATIDDIRAAFGDAVADLVSMLTDVAVPADGNRAARVAINRAHTATASPAAKTIKLADLISNTRSITAHDPSFARVYVAEKAALLPVLTAGDPTLMAEARRLIERYRRGTL